MFPSATSRSRPGGLRRLIRNSRISRVQPSTRSLSPESLLSLLDIRCPLDAPPILPYYEELNMRRPALDSEACGEPSSLKIRPAAIRGDAPRRPAAAPAETLRDDQRRHRGDAPRQPAAAPAETLRDDPRRRAAPARGGAATRPRRRSAPAARRRAERASTIRAARRRIQHTASRQPQPLSSSLLLRTIVEPSLFVWICSPSTVVSIFFPSGFSWSLEPSGFDLRRGAGRDRAAARNIHVAAAAPPRAVL